jgi:glycosyltransferase involved in cell wall biosynthesis
MHMGCAIVAPATDNTKEILRHEHDALLFEANNFEALREAVERLVDDADLRQRLGRSAKETIVERGYLWSENANRVASLFRRLGTQNHS